MNITPINNTTFNGNIRIDGKQNKHVYLLYNHMNDLVKKAKCGAVFKTGEDIIEITPPTKKATNLVKETLEKLKVIFTEK